MKKALLIAGLALPALYALAVLCTHWVALPYWDDWGTPGEQIASWYRGTLTLPELFNQHNEHRRFFPRLLALAVTSVAGWDVRYLMVIFFAFVCAGAAGLYALLRRTIRQRGVRVAAFAAINLLLFSPRGYETFLTGSILGDLFVPAFAIVAAALVNLSAQSLRKKTIMNAALAFISTYSFGNGMLVWLFAFPLETNPTPGARRRLWRTVYIAAAAAAIGGYFIGYHHPPLAPAPASFVKQPAALLTYFLLWIGNLFLTSQPLLLGAVVSLTFVALAAVAIAQIKGNGEWRAHYPWLLLGSYSLISGCLTARSRLGLGFAGATHYRYTAVTMFLYIAIAGLCASIFAQVERSRSRRAFALSVGVLLAVMMLGFWTGTFSQERRIVKEITAHRTHLQLAMRWSEAIPNNPDLALLSPYKSTLATIHTLAEHDVLRPRLIGAELARAVSQPPPALGNAAGALDQVQWGAAAGELVFKGWAYADCVVIGYETADGNWRLLTVTEARTKRRDVVAQFPDGPFARPKFSHSVKGVDLPPGENTFRAWGIDLVAERAWPLAGAIRLPNGTR